MNPYDDYARRVLKAMADKTDEEMLDIMSRGARSVHLQHADAVESVLRGLLPRVADVADAGTSRRTEIRVRDRLVAAVVTRYKEPRTYVTEIIYFQE